MNILKILEEILPYLNETEAIKEEISDKIKYENTEENFDKELELYNSIVTSYNLNEEDIKLILKAKSGYETINIYETNFLVDLELVKILPKYSQHIKNFIPFEVNKNEIKIAISSHVYLDEVNFYAQSFKKTPRYFIDTLSNIAKAEIEFKQKWYDGIDLLNEEMEAQKRKLQEQEEEIKLAMENAEIELKLKKEEEYEEIEINEAKLNDTSTLVNLIIVNAINKNASDIHIEIFKRKTRVRYRIDGYLEEFFFPKLKDLYPAVISRIKTLSELNIIERRKPQDGSLEFRYKSKVVDLRVSILPVQFGEKAVIRIFDKEKVNLDIDKMNIPEETLKEIKKVISSPRGILLVTGPTGSGKSTTLYGCLSYLNKIGINILTAEDPVEYIIEGINQVKIRPEIGYTFAVALKSFLRQDPEVIMVGEIRDLETLDMSLKSSLTGHFVLSTIHTNDAPSTIMRLIHMGAERYVLASSLSMIIAQRLLRKNCSHCIQEDNVSMEELKEIGFQEEELKDLRLQKGKGCINCNNTGFKGRKGIFEYLTINDGLKELILKTNSSDQIKNYAIEKMNFKTLQDYGRDLLKKGIISIKEYKRVLISEN